MHRLDPALRFDGIAKRSDLLSDYQHSDPDPAQRGECRAIVRHRLDRLGDQCHGALNIHLGRVNGFAQSLVGHVFSITAVLRSPGAQGKR